MLRRWTLLILLVTGATSDEVLKIKWFVILFRDLCLSSCSIGVLGFDVEWDHVLRSMFAILYYSMFVTLF